ncbi:MAG: amidase [Rhodococcus sp. (in: high G+C Gram-positive bacteria)]|uniref:amidase n=1 Tax=Rhodococcus sp. TaxID=1831 RepID=UPI003BAEE444
MASKISRRLFLGTAAWGAAGVGMTRAPSAYATSPRSLPAPGDITETDPGLLSAVEAASLLQARALHPRELLDACLRRSADSDGDVNAWARIYPETAYHAAEQAAQRLSRAAARETGETVPLVCGLPLALKDLYAVAGLPLTASSKVLEGNIAAGDSGVWRRLRDAGMVLMGHTHTHEFAIGVSTPRVGNPWNPAYSAGGSSGGSAAALAAGFVPLATGTDTGGSLRFPASMCGVSSIKPTFGRCSMAGVIPLTWTRDHAGPMGRSLADASLLLTYMAGYDVDDPSTGAGPEAPRGGYPLSAQRGSNPLGGRRFGIPMREAGKLTGSQARLFQEFVNVVRQLGGVTVDVTMPSTPSGLLVGDMAEAGAYHQQFSDRLGLYDTDNAMLVAAFIAALAGPVADFLVLERDRMRFRGDYNRMFDEHRLDAIVLPGTTVDGAKRTQFMDVSVFSAGMGDVRWANYVGAPVVQTPVGRSSETGIPFGVQLGGRPWGEAELIALGLEVQEALPAWRERPTLPVRRREITEVAMVAPSAGPDATNTRGAAAPFHSLPTNSVAGE